MRVRTLSPADYARIDIPTLVANGNFDLAIGAMTLWRQLEANLPGAEHRRLLVGPWDHGQCYAGGASSYGLYTMGEHSVGDLVALRLAFFDQHLKRQGCGPDLGGCVTAFITGANEWRHFDSYPPVGVIPLHLYLSSGGHANSARSRQTVSSTTRSCLSYRPWPLPLKRPFCWICGSASVTSRRWSMTVVR